MSDTPTPTWKTRVLNALTIIKQRPFLTLAIATLFGAGGAELAGYTTMAETLLTVVQMLLGA